MKNRLLIISALIIYSCLSLSAQRNPDKVIKFDNQIDNILINEFNGNVLVKDDKSISCYNPETGSIEWTITEDDMAKKTTANKIDDATNVLGALSGDFTTLFERKKELISFIPGTAYVSLTLNDADIIVDGFTGKMLYNSRDFGYRILSTEFIPSEDAFLMTVVNNKSYACVLYNLKGKKEVWIAELSPVESFGAALKGMLSSINIFKSGDEVARDIVITTDKNIYASLNGTLYKLDKSNGKVDWKSADKITNFILNNAQTHIISMQSSGNLFRSRTSLNLLDANTGKKVWDDDLTTKYISYIEDSGNKVMVAHASGLNFYKYADGKKVWKKDAKGKNIKQVTPIDGDYLYIADKEMNLIDKDGVSKWKKPIEICDKDEDQVYHLNKIDNNRVFYLTDSYGNMVDYTTGKKVWKKDVEFSRDRPLLYSFAPDKNVYIAYNDKKIYRFDPNGKDEKKNEPFAKLKKVKSDDTMADIELFDWGVSLVSEEDVIGVDFDGNILYSNTYKDPGANKRRWAMAGRIVASAAGQVATQAGAQSALSSAFSGDSGAGGVNTMYAGAITQSIAENSEWANKLTQRMKAMQANPEYAFILNKGEQGTEIVKVRKSDGKEVDKVLVQGTAPIYEVDFYNYNLYFVNKDELQVFSQN